MNADGPRPMTVRISVGAAMPSLSWIGTSEIMKTIIAREVTGLRT